MSTRSTFERSGALRGPLIFFVRPLGGLLDRGWDPVDRCYGHWEEMTAAEVAATLELPLGAAETRIRCGHQLLEQALGELATAGALLKMTVNDLDGRAAGLRGDALSG